MIKFRGIRIDNGEWAWGFYIEIITPDGFHRTAMFDPEIGHIPVHPESIGMYTGIKDKNNVEIYGSIPIDGKMSRGGDIVLCEDGGENFPEEYDDIADRYEPTGKYDVIWAIEHNYPAFDLRGFPVEDCNSLAYATKIGTCEVIGSQWEDK